MSPVKTLGGVAAALLVVAALVVSEAVVWPEKKGSRQIVTYWEKWTDFEGEAMRKVVEAYNRRQTKYEVRLLTVSNIQGKTLLATAGGVPPDVAGLGSNDLAQYALANAALPLESMAARDGIKRENYVPIYWDICTMDGRLWGLPTTPGSTAFHYNKEHWREAGLDPSKPPKTLSELDAMAEKLTIRDGDSLVRAGFLPAEPGWWSDRWGVVFGAKMWDEKTGKITADSPENIAAYTWTKSYAKKYGVQMINNFKNGLGNFSSPQNGFLSDKVSSVLQGVWMYNFINRFSPKMDWDAVPFPYPDGHPELANSSYIDADVLIIPRGAKNPAGAWDFIKYVQSQEGMEMLCLGQRKHSPLRKVSEKFWKESKNPRIRLFHQMGMSKNASACPPLGIWSEYSAEMSQAFDRINRGDDVRKALHYVTVRMQPKLDKELKLRKARMAQREAK